MLLTNNLIQHIQTHTHVLGNILDFVITSRFFKYNINKLPIKNVLSDHYAVPILIDVYMPPLLKRYINYRNISSINVPNFCSDLRSSICTNKKNYLTKTNWHTINAKKDLRRKERLYRKNRSNANLYNLNYSKYYFKQSILKAKKYYYLIKFKNVQKICARLTKSQIVWLV